MGLHAGMSLIKYFSARTNSSLVNCLRKIWEFFSGCIEPILLVSSYRTPRSEFAVLAITILPECYLPFMKNPLHLRTLSTLTNLNPKNVPSTKKTRPRTI